jgi:hypothetical protein
VRNKKYRDGKIKDDFIKETRQERRNKIYMSGTKIHQRNKKIRNGKLMEQEK